jgi:host factor-I protein
MYQGNSFRKIPNQVMSDHSPETDYDSISGPREAFRSFKNANLQEIFLNNCRKNGNIVSVYLLSGEIRRGIIVGFDNQSIILDANHTQNLIYKSSITSVIPEDEVQYIFGDSLKRELCCSNVPT